MSIALVERTIQLKCLTITVDDRELFSGEVAELQWTETADSVGVTARFTPAPSIMDSLKQFGAAAQQKKQQAEPPPPLSQTGQSPAEPPHLVPPLDTVDGE